MVAEMILADCGWGVGRLLSGKQSRPVVRGTKAGHAESMRALWFTSFHATGVGVDFEGFGCGLRLVACRGGTAVGVSSACGEVAG